MIKWKFFMSLLKEREWLESMARQGWLLTDINMGMRYHFKEIEPSEKVYELERFALSYSRNAKRQELKARKTALDIAKQTGWEVAARDEALNIYFVKDKTNDGFDELYDDDDIRKQRAEKYRKHYAIEQPKMLLTLMLIGIAIFSSLLYLSLDNPIYMQIITIVFLVFSFIEVGCALMCNIWGEKMYKELCLSREEWEKRKKNNVKASFNKIDALIDFLNQKDSEGLRLVECDNKIYIFEETKEHYTYYADTKKAMVKRMKKQGKKYQYDKKDLEMLGTRWHEMSMEEAEQLGLETVCAVEGGTVIYRCSKDKLLLWDTGAEKTARRDNVVMIAGVYGACAAIGFVCGLMWGIIEKL